MIYEIYEITNDATLILLVLFMDSTSYYYLDDLMSDHVRMKLSIMK